MKGFCKGLSVLALVLCAALFGQIWQITDRYPDSVRITDVDAVESRDVSLRLDLPASIETVSRTEKASYSGKWALWGIVPVKSVTVTTDGKPRVRVCGTPFGIKLYTDGVLVVGMTPVDSTLGSINPAAQAGLEIGDRILAIDGQTVTENEQVSQMVTASGGRSMEFTVERGGVSFAAHITPVKSLSDGVYHAGMWVRDSAAGVGMLTFYDPVSGVCAGLGHAICDRDTGIQLSMAGGELVPAAIFDVVRGKAGEAGALCGTFAAGSLGALAGNTDKGIYGLLTTQPEDVGLYEIAAPYEVETGKAQMLCTVDERPAWYEVEITKVNVGDTEKQSMTIRVTDEALLEKTGGILQGMSGSPIIQNGKLIGAVTHVLVNDPAAGYALFAQTMYEEAQTYADTPAETLATSIGGVTVSISPDAA
ncbi:MAG: SpoIVB peptidase [Clostridia bacterium]|nr:SpoIVB peptidase [Clostridia bacterium]